MSLPLVVSAMKMHSMQIRNMRDRRMQEAYVKKHGLKKNTEPNLKSSKAHLHNRKSSTRKRVKKKSSRRKVVAVDQNDSKAQESNLNNVSCNKTKKNQEKPHALMSTKGQSTTKNEAKTNSNDLKSSSAVIVCSVRQLISSYSTKNIPALPQNVWKNPKISPRPQTSSGRKRSERTTSEIKIKRQSCPPPIFQPFESPKNVKLKKVYYSEAQSQMLAGVPCVPPTTPLNDYFVAVKIVPCLADIKSQQAIKTKLKCLVTHRQRADEKIREKILKEEKRKEREEIESLKQQRRAEIYALNEVMTEHERCKFLKFMEEKKNGTTKISLKV